MNNRYVSRFPVNNLNAKCQLFIFGFDFHHHILLKDTCYNTRLLINCAKKYFIPQTLQSGGYDFPNIFYQTTSVCQLLSYLITIYKYTYYLYILLFLIMYSIYTVFTVFLNYHSVDTLRKHQLTHTAPKTQVTKLLFNI